MPADALNRLNGVSFMGRTLRVEWGKNKDGTVRASAQLERAAHARSATDRATELMMMYIFWGVRVLALRA